MGRHFNFARWTASATLFVLMLTVVSLVNNAFGFTETDYVCAQLIGAVASGIGVQTNFLGQTTLHQYLYFEIATTPQSVKVTLNGKTVICDLDTAGLNALRNVRSKGAPTNGFLIPLATGLTASNSSREVNLDINIVNNVAAAFNLFGANDDNNFEDNPKIIQSLGVGLNAGQSVDVRDFVFFTAPSMAANDLLNVFGYKRNSKNQRFNSQWASKSELEVCRGLLQMYQNQAVNPVTAAVDNFDQYYAYINFIPTLAQKIYVQRLADLSGKAITRIV